MKSKHGDWDLRCDTPAGATTQQCVIMQFVTAQDRQNVGLSVVVMKTADKQARIFQALRSPAGEQLVLDDNFFIEKILPAHAVVASNTSGLSLAALSAAVPESVRPRFCGVHFFNPPAI